MQVAEHRALHQLGVQLGDAVDLVRPDEGEEAHAHAAAAMLVDQRDVGRRDVLDAARVMRVGHAAWR